MSDTCATCHEPRVPLIQCADCPRLICEPCSFGKEIVCCDCQRRRDAATDDVAALRWYERRGHLGDAPAPEHRASLLQRGLVTSGDGGIVLTVAGKALLAGLCPETGDPVEECEHIELAEGVELGGEGGFA